jgi:hypothetical protein
MSTHMGCVSSSLYIRGMSPEWLRMYLTCEVKRAWGCPLTGWGSSNFFSHLLCFAFVCVCADQVKAFAVANNIKLMYIPAGMTSVYQPLDTHINGVIKSLMGGWVRQTLADGIDITLVERKRACTRFLRKLRTHTIIRAFMEALWLPCMKERVMPVLSEHAQTAVDIIDSIMRDFMPRAA